MIYLAAGNSEDALWSQLLVAVVLAAGWGLYTLFMKHKARHGSAGNTFGRLKDITAGAVREWFGLAHRWLSDRAAQRTKLSPGATEIAPSYRNIPAEQTIQPVSKKRDLTSGTELLDRKFLVPTVERTDSADRRDITMRCLCFAELVRRDELWAVASPALKVYTVDEQGFYGKSIRCEAMKELATRTGAVSEGGTVPEGEPSVISEKHLEPHQPSEKAMESRLAGI